jgi:hypothetical protein
MNGKGPSPLMVRVTAELVLVMAGVIVAISPRW